MLSGSLSERALSVASPDSGFASPCSSMRSSKLRSTQSALVDKYRLRSFRSQPLAAPGSTALTLRLPTSNRPDGASITTKAVLALASVASAGAVNVFSASLTIVSGLVNVYGLSSVVSGTVKALPVAE